MLYNHHSVSNATANITLSESLYQYAACTKGFFQGFGKGLYANNTFAISNQCLDSSTIDNLEKFINSTSNGTTVANVIPTVNSLYQFTYLVSKTCEFNDITFDISSWCTNNDCSITTLVQNALSRIFQITAALNDIAANTFTGQDVVMTTQAYFNKYDKLGTNYGKIMRYFLNYEGMVAKKFF